MAEVFFIGLSVGSILLLVALGLAITYGAMGVINMAHGDLVMVGAYTTVMSSIWLHLGFLAAIPVAFVVTALIGLAIAPSPAGQSWPGVIGPNGYFSRTWLSMARP